MSKLSAEAYAIVEGRHADPFHYLGLHKEGDKTVVRAFLPEASNVEAVGEHGETAKLVAHPRCRAVCRRDAERRRSATSSARSSATMSSSSKTPIAFRRSCPTTISICSAKARDQQLYDKLGAHPLRHGWRRGRRPSSCWRRMRGASAWSAISISGTRGGIRCACAASAIGSCSFRTRKAGDHYKFDMIGPHGQHLPLKSDPLAFAAEVRPKTASIVLDETTLPQPAPGARRASTRAARRCRSTRFISARGGARTTMSG